MDRPAQIDATCGCLSEGLGADPAWSPVPGRLPNALALWRPVGIYRRHAAQPPLAGKGMGG